MSSPSGAAQAHRLLIQLLCSCAASLLLLLSASLSACSVAANPPLSSANATASAHAQATKVAVATRTAAPVWVDVVAIVEGTTSQRNVRLRVTTTVTNWTGAPIHLAATCIIPMVQVIVRDPSGNVYYETGPADSFCPPTNPVDLSPAIVPGSSFNKIELVDFSGRDLVALTYTVASHVHFWHQGTVEQAIADSTIPQGQAEGQTSVAIP